MERSRSHQSARREWELTAGSADYPVSARWVSHSTGLLVTAASDLNRSAFALTRFGGTGPAFALTRFGGTGPAFALTRFGGTAPGCWRRATPGLVVMSVVLAA